MPIELVIFDIAGTLVEDHDEVTSAFYAALTKNSIQVSRDELREWKGGAKREVIRRFVERQMNGPHEALVEKTFNDFRPVLSHHKWNSCSWIAGSQPEPSA